MLKALLCCLGVHYSLSAWLGGCQDDSSGPLTLSCFP